MKIVIYNDEKHDGIRHFIYKTSPTVEEERITIVHKDTITIDVPKEAFTGFSIREVWHR